MSLLEQYFSKSLAQLIKKAITIKPKVIINVDGVATILDSNGVITQVRHTEGRYAFEIISFRAMDLAYGYDRSIDNFILILHLNNGTLMEYPSGATRPNIDYLAIGTNNLMYITATGEAYTISSPRDSYIGKDIVILTEINHYHTVLRPSGETYEMVTGVKYSDVVKLTSELYQNIYLRIDGSFMFGDVKEWLNLGIKDISDSGVDTVLLRYNNKILLKDHFHQVHEVPYVSNVITAARASRHLAAVTTDGRLILGQIMFTSDIPTELETFLTVVPKLKIEVT